MILAIATFAHLAASCGPTVHADTLTAIAKSESGFDTLAIYDNSEKQQLAAKSLADAVMISTDLIAKGHAVDLGLMQINSGNLARLHLRVSDAFDACANIRAGAKVLVEDYKPPGAGMPTNPAIDDALSRYNTGDPVRGFQNGYVAKVNDSAAQIVPALHAEAVIVSPPLPTDAPPSWNIYGNAEYARRRANPVFGASNYQPRPGTSASAPSAPSTPSTMTPTDERN